MVINVVIKDSSFERAYTNSQSNRNLFLSQVNLEIDFFCNSAYRFSFEEREPNVQMYLYLCS